MELLMILLKVKNKKVPSGTFFISTIKQKGVLRHLIVRFGTSPFFCWFIPSDFLNLRVSYATGFSGAVVVVGEATLSVKLPNKDDILL